MTVLIARREKLRFRAIYLLDRFRRFCWSDLVSWALYADDGEHSLRNTLAGDRCRIESMSNRDLSCYCSKFCDGKRLSADDAAAHHERVYRERMGGAA